MIKSKKAQIMYYDFIIGVILFGLVIAIFLNSYSKQNDVIDLKNEALSISQKLMNDNLE